MANYEQTRYNYSGENLQGIEGVNTGIIVPWMDSSIPSGFLECNGSAVNRTTYSALFAVVGTTYGIGDGSTTFSLPDLQDNIPVGKSGTKALASTGGANTVTGTGNLGGSAANATLSTAQLASHLHSNTNSYVGFALAGGNTGANRAGMPPGNTSSEGSSSGHAHNLSATFSGDANSVLQPYTAVVYIIKT